MTSPAAHFGDPPTAEHLGGTATRTASELERLQGMLNGQVTGLIPGAWSGQAATAFGEHWRQQHDATGRLGTATTVFGSTMRTLSGALAAAKARFEAAQRTAHANSLVIMPDLTVIAVNPSDQRAAVMVPVVQAEVHAARAMAVSARQAAMSANDGVGDTLQAVLDILLLLLTRGRGRPRPRPRRDPPPDRDEAWRRREQEIEDQRRREFERHERHRPPNYRQDMERLHGPPPADGHRYHAHHNFPVERSAELRRMGIEPDNPAWGSWVRETDHRAFSDQFRRDWNAFLDNNPNATRSQAFDFARMMARKYGYTAPF